MQRPAPVVAAAPARACRVRLLQVCQGVAEVVLQNGQESEEKELSEHVVLEDKLDIKNREESNFELGLAWFSM